MKRRNLLLTVLFSVAILFPTNMGATKFIELKIIDKDYLMLHFRDGEVRYRDDGTGPSAYLGHSFAEGDDTLIVFGRRLDPEIACTAAGWTISSSDDRSYGKQFALAAYRKSKPMNTDHTLTSELDHWIFLQLPRSMKQGCSYTVEFPAGLTSDIMSSGVKFDIWESQSEAVHVNILGYTLKEQLKAADLYLWLGDGGQRDYKPFEGNRVYLYNVATGKKERVGTVKFWKSASESGNEANRRNMTGSDVWNIDFKGNKSGRYRLVVEDVGCSMDFDIDNNVYFQPYRYSLRGYYYMRLGEPVDTPRVVPIPRQPRFIPEVDPVGFTVYKTDLHPWHPDWRRIGGDVWDEPHFKPALSSHFWNHRLPGNPVNTEVRGGHSDAFDWDRHLAHVGNIYDQLLPFILSGGKLDDDDLGIRESGNGIPDLIDEARNEVDFFLSIRDGEAYSQGVTNPSKEWTIMFQAGCTTMAAWANAANCAVISYAFHLADNDSLSAYYRDEAVKAFRFAEKQENRQLDDTQDIGSASMRGRDFRHLAAAYLYNITGERSWEDIMAAESRVTEPTSKIFDKGAARYYQIWGTAAYLVCPHERHYPELYANIKAAVNAQADANNVNLIETRPSRRSANDSRWQVSQNLQLVMMAHYIATDAPRRQQLERAMHIEADWGLGRNPSNTVEMTGLGERHIVDCYTTGRNDGIPGSHPGQTPFNGTETWSRGDGGDARILLARCYPDWNNGGWPHQESFFNQRYLWVNSEFTPRETMRGKMALLAYLHYISRD